MLPAAAETSYPRGSSDLDYRDPMATSEIEKLERRYAENPQGLTFAPLAEVHRKNGDVTRALELLRAGLELHPNYIPASIVLGRCHWDLGDLPAAEAAFAHVLRLDDENVIALKSLADINERLERLGEAQRWLHRLVSVDRSNEEARQQLARLETAKTRGDRKAGSGAHAAPEELPHEIAAAEPKPAARKPSPDQPPAEAPPPAAAPVGRRSSEIAPLDLTEAIAEPPASVSSGPPGEIAAAASSTLEFLDTSKPGPARAADTKAKAPQQVEGLASQEFVPPQEGTYRLHPELTQEILPGPDFPDRVEVETAEAVELNSSGASEFRVPNAAEDFLDLATRMNAAREGTPILDSTESTVEATSERPTMPAPEPVPRKEAPPPRREEPPHSGGLKLVTDTGSPMRSYAARDTKGQSVADFFKALLASRPAGHSAAPRSAGGDLPAGAAANGPDLTPVGGEASGTQAQSAAANGPVNDAAVSFDDFFSSPGGGATPPSAGQDPSNDDLDQFQSWLQNLKR